MSSFTSKASGVWATAGQVVWNEVGSPVAGDTVSIGAGHAITLDAAAACATITIAATGSLDTTGGNYSLTLTGACEIPGTLTLNDSTCEFVGVAVKDGGLLSVMTADCDNEGDLTIGDGVSGSMTFSANSDWDQNGTTLTINAGATLGSAVAYTIDIDCDFAASSGTLVAPTSTGHLYFRDGNTWRTPTTFTHNSGTMTFLGSGTTTIGNDSTQFYDLEVANFTTLATGTYAVTTARDFKVGGGASGIVTVGTGTTTVGRNLMVYAAASYGTAATAHVLHVAGNVYIGVGAALIAPSATGSFTVGGTWTNAGGTLTHSSGTITFDDSSSLAAAETGFNALSITGTLTTGGTSYALTAVGAVTVGASGTFSGFDSVISMGSIKVIAGGTYNQSTDDTTITGENASGYGIENLGTWVHNNGRVVFTTLAANSMATGGDYLYSVLLNRTGQILNFADGATVLDGSLTITAGSVWCANTAGIVGYDLTVKGSTTVTDMLNLHYDSSDATVILTGAVSIGAAGTLQATDGSLTLSGNLTLTAGGTFAHNSGSVVLGTGAQAITGTWIWNNLDKHVAAAATLTIDNTSTQTVEGALNLYGAAAQRLTVKSDSNGNAWSLVLTGTKGTVANLIVQDSDASGSDADMKPIAPTGSTDVSGNTDWFPTITQPAMQVVVIS